MPKMAAKASAAGTFGVPGPVGEPRGPRYSPSHCPQNQPPLLARTTSEVGSQSVGDSFCNTRAVKGPSRLGRTKSFAPCVGGGLHCLKEGTSCSVPVAVEEADTAVGGGPSTQQRGGGSLQCRKPVTYLAESVAFRDRACLNPALGRSMSSVTCALTSAAPWQHSSRCSQQCEAVVASNQGRKQDVLERSHSDAVRIPANAIPAIPGVGAACAGVPLPGKRRSFDGVSMLQPEHSRATDSPNALLPPDPRRGGRLARAASDMAAAASSYGAHQCSQARVGSSLPSNRNDGVSRSPSPSSSRVDHLKKGAFPAEQCCQAREQKTLSRSSSDATGWVTASAVGSSSGLSPYHQASIGSSKHASANAPGATEAGVPTRDHGTRSMLRLQYWNNTTAGNHSWSPSHSSVSSAGSCQHTPNVGPMGSATRAPLARARSLAVGAEMSLRYGSPGSGGCVPCGSYLGRPLSLPQARGAPEPARACPGSGLIRGASCSVQAIREAEAGSCSDVGEISGGVDLNSERKTGAGEGFGADETCSGPCDSSEGKPGPSRPSAETLWGSTNHGAAAKVDPQLCSTAQTGAALSRACSLVETAPQPLVSFTHAPGCSRSAGTRAETVPLAPDHCFGLLKPPSRDRVRAAQGSGEQQVLSRGRTLPVRWPGAKAMRALCRDLAGASAGRSSQEVFCCFREGDRVNETGTSTGTSHEGSFSKTGNTNGRVLNCSPTALSLCGGELHQGQVVLGVNGVSCSCIHGSLHRGLSGDSSDCDVDQSGLPGDLGTSVDGSCFIGGASRLGGHEHEGASAEDEKSKVLLAGVGKERKVPQRSAHLCCHLHADQEQGRVFVWATLQRMKSSGSLPDLAVVL